MASASSSQAASPHQEPCAREAVFHLSRTCLEGALDVIRTLEQEYRILYGRNLTLARLPEAVILPLCPDKLKRKPGCIRSSTRITGRSKDLMVRIWLGMGA